MRLIDADALWEELGVLYHQNNGKVNWNDALMEIKTAPTIEPERKTGKWIPVDSYSACGGDEATWMAHGNPIAFYYCSECKEQTYADENGDSILSKFCPNCGAKM